MLRMNILFSRPMTPLTLSRLGSPPTPRHQLPQEEVRTQQSAEAEEEAKVEGLRKFCQRRAVVRYPNGVVVQTC